MVLSMERGDGAVLNEADTASSYREWSPDGPPGVVACRWEQRIGPRGPGHTQRVLPDACADVIVSGDGSAVVVGPTMRVGLPWLPPGAHLRGLRFRTEAVAAALGCPGSEARDLAVPLDALLPPGVARQVAEAVWEERFPEALGSGAVDRRVRWAVGRLVGSPETDVADVAFEIGVTGRHLRRLVRAHTGLGPASLQRVGRLQRFLRLADPAWPGTTLAVLAADAGYADQAHLSREVRDLAGTTPSALLRERSGAPGASGA